MKTLQPNTQNTIFSNCSAFMFKIVSAVFTFLLLNGFNNSATAQSTFASRHAVAGLEPIDWRAQQETTKTEETTASLARPKLTTENGSLKIVTATQTESIASTASAFAVNTAVIADPDADPDFQPAAAITGTSKAAHDVYANETGKTAKPATAKKH